MYYLDTNICVTCIRQSIKTENIVRRFMEFGYFNIKLSTIVILNDMLIATIALSRNATLVTNNTREFSRIDGLKLDDWTL